MSIEQKEEKSIDDMTFEQAMKELENIVNKIDTGQETLDNIVYSFSRAVLLKQHCEKKLQSAKMKIEKVISQDGKIEEISL